MIKKTFASILSLGMILLLAACNGGGGGGNSTNNDNTNTGYFVDSAVSGLAYVTSSGITGITSATGEFSYAPGDTVTFSIGPIEIGQATAADMLTPVSLVPNADATNDVVVNIARFLQSLDADGDPSNGITISAEVTAAAGTIGLSVTFDAADFDTTAASLVEALRTEAYGDTNTLVSAVDAQAHLESSILLCGRSGSFQGTFVQTVGPGSDGGTWSFTVDTDGSITGTGTSTDGSFGITGSVSSDGTAVVGNVTVGAEFSGTIGLDGSVSGEWTNSTYGTSGTYTGSRSSSTPACGSSSGGGGIIPPSATGTLTLSGADTVHFGTSLTPDYNWYQNPDRPAWQRNAGGRATGIWVDIASDGTAFGVQFSDINEADSNPPLYVYQLGCLANANNANCTALANGVTVDLDAKTVTFTNLELPAYGYNETGPITVNGTLSYADAVVF